MPSEKSLKNLEKRKPFKPNDPRINRDGRPRKMVGQVLKDLDEIGIEKVHKQQVVGAIETLLNLKKSELMKYANDENHSALIRIVARHLIKSGDNDRVFKMIAEMAFGKPNQHTDITTKGDKIDYSKLSDSALEEISKAKHDE